MIGIGISPFRKPNIRGISCPLITGLINTGLTYDTITIGWDDNDGENFDIYYGPTPLTAPDSGTSPTTTSVTNSKVISGLDPETEYSFYVRTNCGASKSGWGTVLTLTTLAEPAVIGLVIDNSLDPYSKGLDVFTESQWTKVSNAATTYTWGANTIRSVNTVANYNSLIRFHQWNTMAENFTITSRVKVNSLTANDVLFFTGLQGVSSFSQITTLKCAFWVLPGAFQGFQEIYYNSNANIVATSGAARLVIALNDVIESVITISGLVTTFTVRNITTPTVDQTCSWTNTNALVSPGTTNTNLMNINQVCFGNYKGDFTLTSLKYSIADYRNVFGALIGDSKLEGYYVGALADRVSSLVTASIGELVNVWAGSGNVTQDILNVLPEIILMNPQKAVVLIGRNDVANAVPSGTWQANLLSIYNQLVAEGIDVYMHQPITEGALVQTAINTYQTATFPAPKVIALDGTWTVATDCSADGVHLSDAGAVKIANGIEAVVNP